MEEPPVYRYTDREGDELRVYEGGVSVVFQIGSELTAVHYGQPFDDLIDALTTIRDNNPA